MKRLAILVAAAAVLVTGKSQAAGPTSELFLTVDPTTTSARVIGIQGTSALFNVPQSPTAQGQSPIAVNSTVRTLGFGNGNSYVGAEYTLAGVPTGSTYAFPAALGSQEVDDGTTNGSFNYAWSVSSGTAYQLNLDWTNPVSLFTLGNASGARLGITYDASNNSLWIAGFDGTIGTLISDYSLTGTLLSSFNIGHGFSGALALDPADGTLWLSNLISGGTLTLEQYTRSASGSFGATQTMLSSQSYTGISDGAFGGEFRYTGTVVPEPSTVFLGVIGVLALAFRRIVRLRRE
ncbi:MAG: PEP-CTERM sorting domain-containing protein [Verrucomicrobiota bacterium]|nr:PEP-CTERM sorting domain-containing protein [Verrucomicrobiota bacterium]